MREEYIKPIESLVFYNKAIDDAVVVVREKYLEDSPLWNQMVDKMIAKLESLKKKI